MNKEFLNICVEEYSSPATVLVSPDCYYNEIVEIMEVKGIRHLPVVKDGKPIGIISERDVIAFKHYPHYDKLKASDIMYKDPYMVFKGSSIEDVAFEMSKRKIGSAIIVDEDRNVDSIFTSTDGLNALIEVVRGDVCTANI